MCSRDRCGVVADFLELRKLNGHGLDRPAQTLGNSKRNRTWRSCAKTVRAASKTALAKQLN
eukprot:165859-Lingulodinium_polyedra.AAC.1